MVLAPLDIPLLINDRVDVALAAEADGVHIGQDDMSPADARLAARPHGHHRAQHQDRGAGQSRAARASRLRRGRAAFTPRRRRMTPRRRSASTACARSLRPSARATPKFPICAVAGINESNAADVIAQGCDGVAVISALSLASDPTAAAANLRAVVDAALARRRHT
ncbi:MAG: thiamine phosphate synthase [Pseudolabrys sp.]